MYLAEWRIKKRRREMAKFILEKGMTVSEFLSVDTDQDGFVRTCGFATRFLVLGSVAVCMNTRLLLFSGGEKVDGYGCGEVESPELPVWVKSPKNLEQGEEEDEEEDFVLPTRLDSLGDWKDGSKAISKTGRKLDDDSIDGVLSPKLICADVGTGTYDDDYGVNLICEVLRKHKFASPEAVIRALDGCSVNVTKDMVEKLLKRFNNQYILAFGFFNWADSQANYRHCSDSYDTMVDILGKAKRFDLMWVLVNEMVQVGNLVSLSTMSKVIRRLANAGRWSDSIDAFHMIEQFGVKKDISSMNVLLDALCKENSVKRAWDIFMEVRDKIPPDNKSFNILIHGWCKANKLEEAKSTMEEMTRCGFSPCVISYTCLIEAYCMVKDFREVELILDEMQSRGCPPNVVTYTIFMHALGKAKETQKAFMVYDKMKLNKCAPDTSFYNSLIFILGRAGRLQDAYNVFTEMSRIGISPNVTTYSTMISCACDHSQEEAALKTLQKLEESSCKPDLKTFSPLLRMACKKGACKLLNYLLDYMFRKDISLDRGTYCLVVDELCRSGKVEQSCLFFEEMVLNGLLPRNQTYCMLIEGLERKKMEKTKGKIQQLMAKAHKLTRCEVSSPRTLLIVNS